MPDAHDEEHDAPRYDWCGFTGALVQHGPDVLIGLDPVTVTAVRGCDGHWDLAGLEDVLDGVLDAGCDLREAVLEALDRWAEQAHACLEENLQGAMEATAVWLLERGQREFADALAAAPDDGPEPPFRVDPGHPLIDRIVAAATLPPASGC